MMIIEALILGLIQGLTEFLPVSSSGHLELAKAILGTGSIPEEGLFFTVLLHFATALATLVVFRRDILDIIKGLFSPSDPSHRVFSFKIILSMIPAVIIGLLFEETLESLFTGNVGLVSFMLLITGLLLLFSDRKKETSRKISYLDSILVGVAQAIAILPGISRSGATLASSILLGIKREDALRFSFLMVVPLIFGKIAKDVLDGAFLTIDANVLPLTIGFLAAFITGIFACQWMISLVRNAKLKYFAYYCFIVGTIGLITLIA